MPVIINSVTITNIGIVAPTLSVTDCTLFMNPDPELERYDAEGVGVALGYDLRILFVMLPNVELGWLEVFIARVLLLLRKL